MIADMPNFDTLLELAQNKPDELEKLRNELADQIIANASAPIHDRLRGLQFQINAARRSAKNPLAACIRISNMMQQSFDELRDALNHTGSLDPQKPRLPAKPVKAPATKTTQAEIINFPTPLRDN